jgi:hypothetical protein
MPAQGSDNHQELSDHGSLLASSASTQCIVHTVHHGFDVCNTNNTTQSSVGQALLRITRF